jgi:hypothetical protein
MTTDKVLKAADEIAKVFGDTTEWLDPKRAAVVKILKDLVAGNETDTIEIKLPNRGAFILCANEFGIKASVASKLLNSILQRECNFLDDCGYMRFNGKCMGEGCSLHPSRKAETPE